MNWAKTFFLMTLLAVILVGGGRLLFGMTGLIVGFMVMLAVNGIAYFFSDRLALRAARAQEVGPADAPQLHALADRLAAEYHVPKPRVYISPDPTPNAFATGRSPQHAAICVNQGLLRILDDNETYGVLAHEFGHVRNRDILTSSVVAVIAGTITLLASIAQWTLLFGGGEEENENGLAVLGSFLFIILAPIAAMLIQLAISRSREYQADRTGALVSRNPLALASALRKLQQVDSRTPSPVAQPAFAHLYIVNPLSGRALSGLFSTHPPLDDRVQRLEAMAAQLGAGTPSARI